MPYVSIIVPIYKVEKYLNQCIDSILNQTYSDFELILVDDGSPDHCPDICDYYAQIDNRVRVIHKENGGLVSARKAGIEIARGEYVLNVDGDDWIDPNMLEIMVRNNEDDKVDILICGYICEENAFCEKYRDTYEPGIYTGESLEKVKRTSLFSGKFYEPGIAPALWNKLFRRSILIKNQMKVDNNIVMGEDVACFYPTLCDSAIIKFIDYYPYHYRRNTSSVSFNYQEDIWMKIRTLYESLQESFALKRQEVFDEQVRYYIVYMINTRTHGYLLQHINYSTKYLNDVLKRNFRRYPLDVYGDVNNKNVIGKREWKYYQNLKFGKYIYIILAEKTKNIYRTIKKIIIKEHP